MTKAKKASYHHGDLRAELVRIGRLLLETEPSPSLRAIARRAQVSHGAPVHHFPTWAHLLSACAADGFRELSGALGSVARQDVPAEQRLTEMGAAYLEFARRHPVVFRLMFNRSAVTERTEEFVHDSGVAYDLLQQAIRDTNPKMSDDRFDFLINSIWALIHGMSVLELESQICRTAANGLETRMFVEQGIQRLLRT